MTYAAGLGGGFVIGARRFQFLGERWEEVLQVRVGSGGQREQPSGLGHGKAITAV